MIRPGRRGLGRLAAVPLALLLSAIAVPLVHLFNRPSAVAYSAGWSSLGQTLVFALGGGAIATVAGAAAGMLLGLRRLPGRTALLAMSVAPIAAPPAFWWIGATKLTSAWGGASGPIPAAVVGGLALAPVTLMLVFAAIRQLPSNLYEAARVGLPPVTRVVAVLLPLLRSPLIGGFVLTVILLLGESELPFLFGFRTAMTDIVTTFAQTYDVARTLPSVVPLLSVILGMGALAARPLMRTVLTSARGAHGVVLRSGSIALSLAAAAPAVIVAVGLSGYVLAIVRSPTGLPRVPVDATVVAVSILEPVACAWIALTVALAAAYGARRSKAMPPLLFVGLLLFCVPAAIHAIGWVGLGQIAGGVAVLPGLAHTARGVPLAVLGFAVGYARLPGSLEDAAALVRMSSTARGFIFVLPLVKWSLAAASALVAALAYADRDVAALLLPPGASRLTLNLYLASANAPSATIGAQAVAVILGAACTVALASLGPALVWRWRE